MSVAGPPWLPPVPGTPNGPYNNSPIPPSMPSLNTPMANAAVADTSPYSTGPFCFGLDQYICAFLPKTIHLGGAPNSMFESVIGGTDIPVQKFCCALTNILCAIVMLIFLLTILGIAVAGLIQ